MQKILIFYLIILPIEIINSQNFILKEDFSADSIKYSIRNEKYDLIQGFYFPTLDDRDSILLDGVMPFKKSFAKDITFLLKNKSNCIIWDKYFNTPILNDSNDFIFQRLYVRNVNKFNILFYSGIRDKWYYNEIIPSEIGYQVPGYFSLSDWKSISDSINWHIGKDSSDIKRIVIIVEPKSQDYSFTIGEFKFVKASIKRVNYNHPLFTNISNNTSTYNINNVKTIKSSPYLINYYYENAGGIFVKTSDSNIDSIKWLVIGKILENYPFYNERKLNKDDILKRFKSLFTNYRQNYENLVTLVNEFHDPHFNIPVKVKKAKEVDPIRIYEFNGHFQIVGIFDTTLKSKITLGDELISINSSPLNTLINNEQPWYNGDSALRRNRAIQQLLKGKLNDEKHISLLHNNDTINLKITYKSENVKIPENFKPKQSEIKILSSGIAYYRINSFTAELWINFINHAEELKKCKGIIFDIRNNGGGADITMCRILSTFISKPVIKSTCIIPATGEKESLVLKPHDKFNFSNIPVAILVNNGSVCASEAFAYLMKTYANAKIIGNERTAGSYAFRHVIIFEDKTELICNTFVNELLYPNVSIENAGLEPDIIVKFRNYKDLYPYNDKSLNVAFEYLNKF